MSKEKPVIEVGITDIDGVFLEPGPQGGLRLLLCTERAEELALRLPAEVLAKLETRLAQAREMQAGATRQ
jgi:hypothetical protein